MLPSPATQVQFAGSFSRDFDRVATLRHNICLSKASLKISHNSLQQMGLKGCDRRKIVRHPMDIGYRISHSMISHGPGISHKYCGGIFLNVNWANVKFQEGPMVKNLGKLG